MRSGVLDVGVACLARGIVVGTQGHVSKNLRSKCEAERASGRSWVQAVGITEGQRKDGVGWKVLSYSCILT